MIVQWFCDLFYLIFTTLLSWVNIPSLGEETISDVVNYIDLIVSDSLSFLFLLIPYTTAKVLITLSITMYVVIYGYYFVMWILKKVPAVGIH